MAAPEVAVVRKSQLLRDLCALGLQPGQVVMLHVSVKAIGWIVGGPDVVLDTLLEVLTPTGTLMMYASREDSPYHMDEWPEQKRRAYLDECPPFDAATTRARRDWSILTEYLRTRSGCLRSWHPEHSMVAIGQQAASLTCDHPLQYGLGPGSPLDKLVQARGKVLMLGSPRSAVTVLHYAEHLANIPDKRVARYRTPIRRDSQVEWIQIEELDSSRGICDLPLVDDFEQIVTGFIATGKTYSGNVGFADSHLLDAQEVVRYAVEWMEREHDRATGGWRST